MTIKKTITISDFKPEDTISDHWADSREDYFPNDPSSSISFLYVDELGEAPKGVLSSFVSFPVFLNKVKVKKNTRSASVRKWLKVIIFFALCLATLVITVTAFSGLGSILWFSGSTIFTLFLLFSPFDEYTQELKDPEVHQVFKPITLFKESSTLYPYVIRGIGEWCSFSTENGNNYRMFNDELYEAVELYITALTEVLEQGEEDNFSEELYTELAKLVIRNENLTKSKQLVENNSHAGFSMEEEFTMVKEEIDLSTQSLIEKFVEAREHCNLLSESTLREDARRLLDL